MNTKRWTLLISKKDGSSRSLVRSFTGSFIPPSSVLWDGRNSSTELVLKGLYSIQLFVVDSFYRTVKSNELIVVY
ncbi:MAG: hypothetical protein JW795_09720 [Chitinivibrionales bacterium]|nr:hypothetical protein [Chitinivibrionales bacterium]